MRYPRSLSWMLLAAALVVAAALAPACAEEEEEGAVTPGATSAASPAASPGPDLSKWTQGVTDTEIKLGTHVPLSETPAAVYGVIAYGMRAYFDYINDVEGGVYGRKITLIIGDDHYNPPDTVEVVRKLVEEDKVFAIVGGLGEETNSAVWKYLEERGIPDMFISSGLHKWTEPVARTRFGGNPDYLVEGRMLGDYIAKNYNGKKLGILMQNNEFGEDGVKGLKMGLEGSDVEIVATETYESITADVTAQTQRLQNAGAEVVAAYAIPVQAASLVRTSRELLDWDVPVIITGVDVTQIFIDLAGKENAEGVMSVVFGHQVYETDNPGIQQHYEIMEKYGRGEPVSNFTLYGAAMADLMVQALKNAGPDLNAETLVRGAESICGYTCPVCLTPISLSPTDHRPMEVEVYNRVEDGKWVAFGEPVDFETTKECPE